MLHGGLCCRGGGSYRRLVVRVLGMVLCIRWNVRGVSIGLGGGWSLDSLLICGLFLDLYGRCTLEGRWTFWAEVWWQYLCNFVGLDCISLWAI
jgi:hypothetical protein